MKSVFQTKVTFSLILFLLNKKRGCTNGQRQTFFLALAEIGMWLDSHSAERPQIILWILFLFSFANSCKIISWHKHKHVSPIESCYAIKLETIEKAVGNYHPHNCTGSQFSSKNGWKSLALAFAQKWVGGSAWSYLAISKIIISFGICNRWHDPKWII